MSNFLENERLCTSGVSRRQPCLPSNRDISTTRTRECASSKIGPEAYMTMRPSDAYVNLPPAVEVDTVEEAKATLARWEVWNVGLQQQLEADPQILPPHSDRGSEERQSTVPRNRNTVFNNPVNLAKEESLPLPSTTPAPFKVAYRTTAATERRKVCRQSTRSSRALLLKRALGLEGKPLGRAGYSEGLKERRMDNDYLSTIKTARGLAVGDDVERGAETEDANHDEIYDVDVVSETGSQERADNEVQNKRLHSVANRLRRQLCFTESADGLNVTSKSKSRLHSCPRSYGAWPKPPTHLPQKLGACEAERQGSSSVPIITSRSSPEDEALSTSHVLPVYIDNQKKEEDEDVTMRPVCAIEKRTSDPTASFSPLYGQFPEAKATMHSSEGVQIAVCSSAHGDVEMQKDLQKNSENEENSDGDKERECAGILKDSEEKKGSNDSRKGSERGEDDEEYIQQSIKEEEDEEDLVMQKGEEEEYFQRPTEEYQKGEDEVLNATNGDQEEEDLQRSMEENEEHEDDVLDDTNEDQEKEDLQGPVEEHGEEEEELVNGTSENQEEEDLQRSLGENEEAEEKVVPGANGDQEEEDIQRLTEDHGEEEGEVLNDTDEEEGDLQGSMEENEEHEDDVLDDTNEDQEEEAVQVPLEEHGEEEEEIVNGTRENQEEEDFQRSLGENEEAEEKVVSGANGDQEGEDVQRLTEDHGEEEGEVVNDADEEEDLQRSMEENEEHEDDVLDDTNEDQEEEELQGPVEEHGEEEEEIVNGTSENQEEEDLQRSLGENEEAEEKIVTGANGDQEKEDVQRLTEDHGEEKEEVLNDTDEEEGDLQGPMEENEEHEDDVLDDTNEDQEEEALQVPLEEHGEEEEEIVNGTSENQEEEDLQRSLGENEEAEEKVVSGANGDQEEEDVQRLTEDHGEEEGEVINDANEVQEEEDLQGPMEDHEKEEEVLDDISESHEEEDFQRSVEEHGEEEEEVLHDTSESQEEEDLQRLTEDHGEEEEKVVNGANELQEEGDLQEPVEENEKHEDEVLNSTNGDQEEVDLKMSLEEHEGEVGKDNFKVSKEGQREEEKDMAEEEEEIKSAIGSKPNGGTMLLKSVTDIPLSERYTLEILTDCAINCPPAERMASEEERNIENKTSYVLSDSNISTFSLARHSCDNVLVDDDSKAKDDAEGDIAKVVPRRVGVSALDSVKCLNSNSNTHYEGMDLSALYIPASSAESFMDTNRAPDPLLEVINTMQDILTDEYTNRLNVLYNERTARDALWLFQSLFDRNRASSASRREIEVSTEATKTTEHLRNALDDAQTTLRFRNHALESTQNELEAHKKEANAACEAFAAREALLRAELDDRMAVLEATREAASTSEAAALRERDAALHSLEALEVRFASLSRDAVSAASGESRQAQLTARLAAALRVAESRTAVANTRAALLASEVTAAEERVNRLRGQRAALVDEVFRKDNLEKTALGFMLWTMRRASVLQLETRQLKHEAQERRRELRLWQNHVCPIRTSLVSRDSVVSSTSNERRSGKSPLLYDQGSIGEVVRERDELREALSGSVAAYEELLAELIVMRNRTEQ